MRLINYSTKMPQGCLMVGEQIFTAAEIFFTGCATHTAWAFV